MIIPPLDSFPDEYADLTLRDLLDRYTGQNAQPLPEVLRPWVVAARKLVEVIDLEREVAELERRRV